jgi:DNA gyrase subunit B
MKPPVTVSVALRWSSDMYAESILSFCNNIRTKDGGSRGRTQSMLDTTINSRQNEPEKLKRARASSEFIREGLTAIVSVSVSEPEFEGQTKGRLGNPSSTTVDSLLASS